MTTKGIFKEAKAHMQGNWGFGVGVTLLALLISSVSSGIANFIPVIGGLVVIILFRNPLMMGVYWLFLGLVDQAVGEKKPSVDNLFDGLRDYARVLAASSLHLLILGAWALLWMLGLTILILTTFLHSIIFTLMAALLMIGLALPVIIAGLSYSQFYYILKDEPQIGAMEALKKSRRLMKGHKGKYLLVQLSLIFLILLVTMPFLIGLGIMMASMPFGTLETTGIFEMISNQLLLRNSISLGLGFLIVTPFFIFWMPFMYACYATFYRRLIPKITAEKEKQLEAFEGHSD